MEVKQVYQIYETLEKVDLEKTREKICKNIKKYRLQLYNKYKKEYNGRRGPDNPYSAFNVAGYLGISETHYRRIESVGNKTAFVNINFLFILCHVFNKKRFFVK